MHAHHQQVEEEGGDALPGVGEPEAEVDALGRDQAAPLLGLVAVGEREISHGRACRGQ